MDPAGCGNLTIQAGEACDDGNAVGGDGCAADCKAIEPGWFCDVAGSACIRNRCGDGRTASGEQCDDSNTASNDGCNAQCANEQGWTCPPGGGRCVAARCGDGIIAGDEDCEDNDGASPTSGDGCSATCRLESGWKCPTAGQACSRTNCGDTITEGTEQCDDGNHDMGDGCSPLCVREPKCNNGTCEERCGDGVILPGTTTEACDDGNLRDNDGCSSSCKLEPGFNCRTVETQPPAKVRIPVVYRDFRGKDLPAITGVPGNPSRPDAAAGHLDFENANGFEQGIVKPTLDANGKPEYAKEGVSSTTTHGTAAFRQWYRDTQGVNITVVGELELERQGSTSVYKFTDQDFFPLDGKGWVALNIPGNPGVTYEPVRNNGHNFSFTSEARYWFEYKGTENFHFLGDDDVWVFINKKLAVDLGGVHGASEANLELSSQAGALGLVKGKIYEVAVFQAERHTTASSYILTLSNFTTKRTECVNTCGDGVVQPPEQCDTRTNPGGYGQCAPGCIWGPRCGDGVVQSAAGEDCDDGNTNNEDSCTNQCKLILG